MTDINVVNRADEIGARLKAAPAYVLFPELAAAAPARLAATPSGQSLLAWARDAAKTPTIPETAYTLYRRFRAVGDRAPYETPYFKKRELLTRETICAWLGQDDARLDRVNDLIWSICEETAWVLPAHEKGPDFIDLFAAETGSELAYVLLLLGDRLPEEIRRRVHDEVERRILDPYLRNALEYGWDKGTNNWTGVCAGSVGEVFLLLELDPGRQAQGIALVLGQLDRFIANAFEPDGGSLEGIGYWNYGLIHYVAFAELLRDRTAGAIDLLAQDKLRRIAQYPLAACIGKDLYASFSDAAEHSSVRPFLAARLAERTQVATLRTLAGGGPDWRIGSMLRNLLWAGDLAGEPPILEDTILPESGLARIVGGAAQQPLVLAVKAGHNAEPHNHNDVGSFVLCVDDVVYLCDPGAGLYSADYFGPKRYDNVFANSYGHSVPRIGGRLQGVGKQFRGALEKTGEKSVQVHFENAYDVPGLQSAVRTFTLENGGMVLQDSYQSQDAGVDVEEALVTWQEVEVDGGTARILSKAGVLEIRVDQGSFTAERLEEACKANHKSGVLTRLAVVYPAAPKITARFTMTFQKR